MDLRLAINPNLSEASSECNPKDTSDDTPKHFRQSWGWMGTPTKKAEIQQVGKRLRDLRFGLAEYKEDPSYKTLRTFAGLTGIDEDSLSNWERGVALVPFGYLQTIKDHFGGIAVFEWVYGGDPSGLPSRLSKPILDLRKPKPVEEPRTDRTRRYRRGAA